MRSSTIYWQSGRGQVTELKKYFKTATDVLRLAVAMSDGDISLAKATKFRRFTRTERKVLLSLLENCHNPTEDMQRWKDRWIRLGEIIHPGEYCNTYRKAAQSFDVVRNGLPFTTFNSQVERALRSNQIDEAINLLRNRPGEFARRLDHLLRVNPSREVVSAFGEVASGISTLVLLQAITHFKHRHGNQDLRIFFPKGNVAKVTAIKYNLPELDHQLCNELVSLCEGILIERFSTLSPLGKVYVDPGLKDYLVPFSQRSASRSLRTLVRGSRIAFPEGGETIRFFLWWKEGEIGGKQTGRVDIDLSAVLFDNNWQYKEHISYTNLRSAKYQAYHSGDITSAPDGACEFIDIDIPSVLNYGGRYIVMSLNSFTHQKFSNLPECWAGWMMRKCPNSGEIFEASTVQDNVDVTSETTICIPVILDIWEQKVIWADLGLKRNPSYVNNIQGNSAQMTLIGKSLTEVIKPDLYSLFLMHAKARGVLVKNEEEAETIFSIERGITPFEIETIMSQYL